MLDIITLVDTSAGLAGEIDGWPTKERMADILRARGLHIVVGRYSIRFEDCQYFSFEQYGGDLGEPCINADADTVEDMIRDAKLVSRALASADIRHRFEIYDHTGNLAAYLHHRWPDADDAKQHDEPAP
jgi:hypothetical protein